MNRAFLTAVLGLTLAGLVTPAGAAGKPKLGVFGKLHGMAFKAKLNPRIPLIQSSYQVDAQTGFSILTFAASERPKRAYQNLVVSCLGRATTPPWSAACIASYAEVKAKRRAIQQNIWLAGADVDGNGNTVGPFNATIESFDGTTVRGRFSGSLESSQSCPNGACSPNSGLGTVTGEGTFALPAS